MKLIVLVILSGVFVSCGKPETTYVVRPASAEEYKYELKSSSCSTGVQSFATLQQTCEGLKNDQLNNFCAKSEREALFINHNCVGNFSE